MATTDLYDTLAETVAGYDPTPGDGGASFFSFTTDPSGAGQLTGLTLNLLDATAATDNGTVTISLYTSTGTGLDSAPGTLVAPAIATLSDASLAAAGGVVTVPISATYSLLPDTRYWVQIAGSTASGVELAYEAGAAGMGTDGEYYYENGTTGPDTTGATIAGVTETVPCFCAGTLILTDAGERAVETLQPGDRVVTATGALEPVRWIGRRSYGGRFLARNPAIRPVSIAPGALGGGLPRRTLRISPQHAMLLDGVLVEARDLVNGTTITQEPGLQEVHYVHLELDRHDAVLAEGAPSETFLDDESRRMFHSSAGLAPPRSHAGYCARRIEAGFELAAIRRRLGLYPAADRAG